MARSPTSRKMSLVEARQHVEALLRPNEPLKTGFPRVAALIRVTPRRIRQFWEGSAHRPRADEIDALRAARAAASERAITRELLDHAAFLETQAARLAVIDPDIHGPEIDRLRDLASRARRAASGEVTP